MQLEYLSPKESCQPPHQDQRTHIVLHLEGLLKQMELSLSNSLLAMSSLKRDGNSSMINELILSTF